MDPKKINVGKTEEITELAEKIIDAQAEVIFLVVPKFSRLAESPAHFRLLKREADALGKKLVVESVDEKIVKLAGAQGIECHNPFFEPAEEKRFSDISSVNTRVHEKPAILHEEKEVEEIAEGEPMLTVAHYGNIEGRVGHAPTAKKRRSVPRFRVWWIGVGAAAIVAILFYVALGVLPKADIKITAAKTHTTYEKTIVADASISAPDIALGKVPAQVFEEKKNLQLQYPASGKKDTLRKAMGMVTLHNSFSSAPQSLVATTRLQTPDGKIFRLIDSVVIPGAATENGKLVPSSIDARVVADQAGESYNVAPVAKFTIPGFSGSPKFQGFYAESKAAMSGGLKGVAPYPTPADIESAKKSARDTLENSMRTLVETRLPKEFKLIEGAERFEVLSEEVTPEVNESGQFTVSTEATMTLTVFREQDLKELVLEKVQKDAGTTFEIKEQTLTYGAPTFQENDALSFPFHAEATLARSISVADAKSSILGKNETELRAAIFALSGVESAHISLWPFWVGSVPKNADKVTITID